MVQKHTGLYPMESYEREIRYLLGMPGDSRVETFVDNGQVLLKNVANATELPGVSFAGLTDAQRKTALRRMNSEIALQCGLTVAQCRLSEPDCPVSGGSDGLAAKVVKEVREAKTPPVPLKSATATPTGQ